MVSFLAPPNSSFRKESPPRKIFESFSDKIRVDYGKDYQRGIQGNDNPKDMVKGTFSRRLGLETEDPIKVEREAEENGIPEESKKYPVDHPPAVRGRVVAPKELKNKGECQDENNGDQVFKPLAGGFPYSCVSHYLSQY
jgi:hypothetical protein